MISINYLFENNSQTKRSRVGIFIIKDGKILVGDTTKDKYNPYKYKYIIPGGGIEPGESLIDTASRECREEIAVLPKDIKILNKKYLKCDLKQYGFKYDCSELFYTYGYYDKDDKSVWGIDDGFKIGYISLTYDEIVEWLIWCIQQTKNEPPKVFKYKADLEVLKYMRSKKII